MKCGTCKQPILRCEGFDAYVIDGEEANTKFICKHCLQPLVTRGELFMYGEDGSKWHADPAHCAKSVARACAQVALDFERRYDRDGPRYTHPADLASLIFKEICAKFSVDPRGGPCRNCGGVIPFTAGADYLSDPWLCKACVSAWLAKEEGR